MSRFPLVKMVVGALGIFAFFVPACSKPNGPGVQKQAVQSNLRGQVFVIQQNRVNVKLGAVKVSFVPQEKFRERSRWISQNQAKAVQIADYMSRLEQLDRWLSTSQKQSHARKADDFLRIADQLQKNNWGKFNNNALILDFVRLNEIQKENADIFRVSGFGGAKDGQWFLASLFFEWLPQTEVATAETDADGNYSLSIEGSPRGYIFAQSSRLVSGRESEHYFWLQEVDPKDPAPVQLTSKNLLDPATLAGMVHPPGESPRVSMKLVVDEFGLNDLEWYREAETLMRDIASNQGQIEKLNRQIKGLEDKVNETKALSEP